MPTMLTDTPTATACATCGDLVLHAPARDGHFVTLDAEPVHGGIYHVTRDGHAERRSLVVLYAEQRAGMAVDGLDPHECTTRAWYDRG